MSVNPQSTGTEDINHVLDALPFGLSNDEKKRLFLPNVLIELQHHFENNTLFRKFCEKQKIERIGRSEFSLLSILSLRKMIFNDTKHDPRRSKMIQSDTKNDPKRFTMTPKMTKDDPK